MKSHSDPRSKCRKQKLLCSARKTVSLPPPPEPPFDIETFEPIEPPWQAIRASIPADNDESPADSPEIWDQTTGTGWKAPEIDRGDGRTVVLEYT